LLAVQEKRRRSNDSVNSFTEGSVNMGQEKGEQPKPGCERTDA